MVMPQLFTVTIFTFLLWSYCSTLSEYKHTLIELGLKSRIFNNHTQKSESRNKCSSPGTQAKVAAGGDQCWREGAQDEHGQPYKVSQVRLCGSRRIRRLRGSGISRGIGRLGRISYSLLSFLTQRSLFPCHSTS